MSILDMLLTNGGSISDGLKAVQGKQEYLIAFDGELVVCYFYNTDAGKALLEKYLKDNGCNVNIDIRKMTLKKDNEFFKDNLGKKIVLLNNEIVLYEEVVKLADSVDVKGYKPNRLKNGINIFSTEI